MTIALGILLGIPLFIYMFALNISFWRTRNRVKLITGELPAHAGTRPGKGEAWLWFFLSILLSPLLPIYIIALNVGIWRMGREIRSFVESGAVPGAAAYPAEDTMRRSAIPFIAAGLLVLAACSSPVSQTEQEGVAFPSYAQYQQVVNTLDGQVIDEAKIVRAFIAHGVRRPDKATTPQSNSGGDAPYSTSMSWIKAGEYSVHVLFVYTRDYPFSANDPARGIHKYKTN